MRTEGGGAKTTPLYIALPTFFSHAPPPLDNDTSIYRSRQVDFSSIDRKSVFWVPKRTRPLWAWPWPCGRDLCRLGKSSLCSLWPCQQGHAHRARATPTKASSSLEPRRPILDRSMKNPLVSIDKWTGGGGIFFIVPF